MIKLGDRVGNIVGGLLALLAGKDHCKFFYLRLLLAELAEV